MKIVFLWILTITFVPASFMSHLNVENTRIQTSLPDFTLLKTACYNAFTSSVFPPSANVGQTDTSSLSIPLSNTCFHSYESCISQPGSPIAGSHNRTLQDNMHTRLSPMQAQVTVTAYKPQQFILNNLLKNPLSSMSQHTIKDHWQLYEGFSSSIASIFKYLFSVAHIKPVLLPSMGYAVILQNIKFYFYFPPLLFIVFPMITPRIPH